MFDFDELEEKLQHVEEVHEETVMVYAISDVHVEIKQNMDWLKGLPKFPDSILVIAGDLGVLLEQIREALLLFKSKFTEVFYCYGNHELWCSELRASELRAAPKPQRGHLYSDSHGKLVKIRKLCAELGVRTTACCVKGVWVVPILGWYHHSWDTEGPLRAPPGKKLVREPAAPDTLAADSGACRWRDGLENGTEALAKVMDAENEAWGIWPLPRALLEEASRPPETRRNPIVTFSHFLPRQELMPEKRFLFQPNLPKIVGSNLIKDRVASLSPDLHIFGHTHFPWDMTIDGTRYRSWPLGSPSEQARRIHTFPIELVERWEPLPVLSSRGEHTPKQKVCWFSEMYTKIKREPDSYHMADYVALAYCPGAPTVPGDIIATDLDRRELSSEEVLRRERYKELTFTSMRRQTAGSRATGG